MKIKVSQQDLEDISICGRMYLGEWKNLFYSLKNKILEHYAMFYGYTKQVWYDYDYYGYDDDNYREHILKRYYLCTQDGRYICREFHLPTNEFYYSNGYGITKKSEGFDELSLKCEEKFEGKKDKQYGKEFREIGFQALKRLVRRYGYLLYK